MPEAMRQDAGLRQWGRAFLIIMLIKIAQPQLTFMAG